MIPPDANLGTTSGGLRQGSVSGGVAHILRIIEQPDTPLPLSGGALSLLSLSTKKRFFVMRAGSHS